jgi:hypothetical protein
MKRMIDGKTWSTRAGALLLLASSTAASLLVSGCGAPAKVNNTPVSSAQGSVRGGQQPIAGVTLQLYTPGTTGYGSASVPLGTSFTTNSSGQFSFSGTGAFTCPSSNTPVFLMGTGGTTVGQAQQNANIKLLAVLGPCGALQTNLAPGSSYFISMNEITTVAAVWSLSGFMTGAPACTQPVCIGAPSNAMATAGIQNAFANANEIVNVSGANAGKAVVAAGGVTPPTDEVEALGNILQNCVNSIGGVASDSTDGNTTGTPCGKLFFLTQLPSTTAPADIVTAALNIAQHPGGNVANVSNANYLQYLFNLQATPQAFPNSLAGPPTLTDWTLAINYTGGGLSSPQTIAADGLGNVWVTNSTGATTGSVTELTINNAATATPVYTLNNYTSNVNAPYGIAIDTNNNAFVTNAGNGTIAEFGPLGATPATFATGLSTPQGIAIDGASNVWVVNNGNNTLSGFTSAGAALTNSPYSGGGLNAPSSIAVNPK